MSLNGHWIVHRKRKTMEVKKNAMHAFFLTIIIFDSDPQSTYFNQRVKNQWFHNQDKVTKQLAAKGFKPLIKWRALFKVAWIL